jgi:hypothetical protein
MCTNFSESCIGVNALTNKRAQYVSFGQGDMKLMHSEDTVFHIWNYLLDFI